MEGDSHAPIVIDIGTTTIFGQILDLNGCVVVACPSGICDGTTLFALAEASDYNAQISYGEDVITRIVYSQKPGGLKKLQEVVVSTINKIIQEMFDMSKIDRSLISHMVIAGNTTMTQLLLALDPKYIREEPYVPTANFIPPVRAVHLGINIRNLGVRGLSKRNAYALHGHWNEWRDRPWE